MNNSDYKKSAGQWTQRLFKQSIVSKTVTQDKTYFGQRYHDNHAVLAQLPFSTLFYDDNHQPKREANTANFHLFFEHESSAYTINPVNFESSQPIDSNVLPIQNAVLQG